MAPAKPNLQARSESYLARLQRRNAKFQDKFINFLKHETRKLLIIEMGSMLLSVLSVQQILSNLKENSKTLYSGGANSIFLSWVEFVADIGSSKVIPQFPNLVVLEFDKSAMDEQDMKVLKNIGERLSTGPSWKKVVLVASEKGRLNNVLQELQSDMFGFLEEPTYKNIPQSTRKSESLYEAASKGLLDEIETFIENGADIDQADADGNTALHMSARNGHKEAVLKLLKNGAKHLHDKKNDTALHLAARHGHVDIVMMLLQHGVNVNIMGNSKYSPLHYASESGRKDVVLKLLQHGAKHLHNENKDTALHLAAKRGDVDIVILLVKHGADVNIMGNSKYSPLHYASESGRKEVVLILLQHGAKHLHDQNKDTALHLAACAGHSDTVIALLEHGADVNAVRIPGLTPLHLASQIGHHDVVRTLILYDANIQATDDSGWTALHCAANTDHKTEVNTLLEFGAEVDTKDKAGRTPLHIAASRGYLEVVKVLIEMGNANLNCKDNNGKTPLDWAKERQQTGTVQYLTSKGAT